MAEQIIGGASNIVVDLANGNDIYLTGLGTNGEILLSTNITIISTDGINTANIYLPKSKDINYRNVTFLVNIQGLNLDPLRFNAQGDDNVNGSASNPNKGYENATFSVQYTFNGCWLNQLTSQN